MTKIEMKQIKLIRFMWLPLKRDVEMLKKTGEMWKLHTVIIMYESALILNISTV